MNNYELELSQVMTAIAGTPKLTVTPEEIVDAACFALEVSKAEMRGPIRKRELSECRFIIAGLCADMLHLKPARIAKHIGNRDRSTALYGIEQYRDWLVTDRAFKNKVSLVVAGLEAICK